MTETPPSFPFADPRSRGQLIITLVIIAGMGVGFFGALFAFNTRFDVQIRSLHERILELEKVTGRPPGVLPERLS